MSLIIQEFCQDDIPQLTALWNAIVVDGVAFPQDTP